MPIIRYMKAAFRNVAYGSRRLGQVPAISGLPRSTDIARPAWLVRLVPNSEMAAIANHVCSTPDNSHLRLERTRTRGGLSESNRCSIKQLA